MTNFHLNFTYNLFLLFNYDLDEVFHRRKFRQRREREERKREKHINEINDRQMGKILSRSANIDIKSTSHFPACFDGNSDDMPVLTKQSGPSADNATARSTSPGPRKKTGGGKTGPSFANVSNLNSYFPSQNLQI